MKVIEALLDKVPKSGALRSNKCSKGNLLPLNGSKGVLEVSIVRRGWLRGRTRSDLIRMRGWMMGFDSSDLVITKHPIKVSPVKKGGSINIGKWQKPVPRVKPTICKADTKLTRLLNGSTRTNPLPGSN